ncbi:MAG: hypothetical protein JWP57_2406 [Spirosoma sp.]|nr:hypothetical protein [Spirosoma sp.]
MENKAKYQLDDWVGAVRSDPRNMDQLTMLQGYLGASSEAGHIRVYSDDSLNTFVEVPEEAILYSVKMAPAESSLGGSKLWLRADAVITFGDPKLANRPKSTFLEGDIMQQYGASPAGQTDMTQMAGAMGGQGDTTGQRVQAMATNLQVFCPPQATLAAHASVCLICPPSRVVICPPKTVIASCFRTICNLLTCRRTLCGPQSCIPVLCGGGGCQLGTQITGTNSIACGPGLPGGPVVNPGFAPMGGQPDTTQIGGYYGTFNPYMY